MPTLNAVTATAIAVNTIITVTTTTVAATAAAHTVTSETCDTDRSKVVAVGAGVGVSLGVLLLLALVGLFFTRRAQMKLQQQLERAHDNGPTLVGTQHAVPHYGRSEVHSDYMSKVPSTIPVEKQSKHIVELDNSPRL